MGMLLRLFVDLFIFIYLLNYHTMFRYVRPDSEIEKINYSIMKKEQQDQPYWERLLEHNKKMKFVMDQKFIEK